MAVSKITYEFEYAIPDKYLYQTTDLGLTAKFTYKGASRFWVMVDKDTNKIVLPDGTWDDDGTQDTRDEIADQADDNEYPVMINAMEEPILAAALNMEIDQADYPQVEFTREQHDATDKVVYYSRAANPTPDHTYDMREVTYDPLAKQWSKPFPFQKPHMTWDDLLAGRDNLVASAERSIEALGADNPGGQWDALIKDLGDFKDELNAIETKFPKTHWDPWMVPFPDDPRIDTSEVDVVEEDGKKDQGDLF